MNSNEGLRYPIGKFIAQESYTPGEVVANINRIEALPAKVESLVKSLSGRQLDLTYREGGWTARQVIHHLPDSHTNAYVRFKWTLTEQTPVIKTYDEKAWAETPEARLEPALSIDVLRTLHVKWVALLRLLTPEELARKFTHPETLKELSLSRMVALYAWHGEHHLGHLQIISKK